MGNASVRWEELVEQARTALTRCTSVVARVRVTEPPGRRIRGTAEPATLEVRFAQPDLWRIERDGELVLLRDGVRHLVRGASGAMERHRREPDWVPGAEVGGLGWGHPQLFDTGRGMMTLAAGPTPARVAGRVAWEVLLTAPDAKPYPLRAVLDQETGLLLRYAAEGTPYVVEVLELWVNEGLPADTFAWDGPVEDRRIQDEQARHAQQAASDLPLPRFWPAEPRWRVERLDPATGAFVARLTRSLGDAVLLRQPVDAEDDRDDWSVDDLPHRYQHRDGPWRWTLLTDQPLDEADVARIWASMGI